MADIGLPIVGLIVFLLTISCGFAVVFWSVSAVLRAIFEKIGGRRD